MFFACSLSLSSQSKSSVALQDGGLSGAFMSISDKVSGVHSKHLCPLCNLLVCLSTYKRLGRAHT